jgi:hypothetical protein
MRLVLKQYSDCAEPLLTCLSRRPAVHSLLRQLGAASCAVQAVLDEVPVTVGTRGQPGRLGGLSFLKEPLGRTISVLSLAHVRAGERRNYISGLVVFS